MLILLKSIYCKFFESNILSCHRVFVCLFNKIYIKLSKSACLSIQQDVYQAAENACLFIHQDIY